MKNKRSSSRAVRHCRSVLQISPIRTTLFSGLVLHSSLRLTSAMRSPTGTSERSTAMLGLQLEWFVEFRIKF